MDALLTIAIPTYNRPVQLRHTLEVILPQILGQNRVRLLVLDNHSEVPATQILNDLGVELNEHVSVIRHPFNIGGNANIMRCFELCETEWVWVLSDDDEPRANAVQTILDDATDAHVFAFYTYPEIALPIPILHGRMTGKTVKELFEAVNYYITPMTMLSACIYRMGALRKRLSKGYGCMSSGIPHLAMVFSELEAGGTWLLSEKTICNYQPPTREHAWMCYVVFLGLPVAYLSFTQVQNVHSFRRCLQTAYRSAPEWLLIHFIGGYQINDFFSLQSGYFFKIMKAFYAPSVFSHPFDWMKWQLTAIASFFPGLFLRAVNWICRILGRPTPCLGDRARMD